MAIVNVPPNQTPFNRKDGSIEPAWAQFMMAVYRSAQMDYGSGTTAQRPTTDLRAGGRYWDTSLGANGRPIWVRNDAASWVDATGAAV